MAKLTGPDEILHLMYWQHTQMQFAGPAGTHTRAHQKPYAHLLLLQKLVDLVHLLLIIVGLTSDLQHGVNALAVCCHVLCFDAVLVVGCRTVSRGSP